MHADIEDAAVRRWWVVPLILLGGAVLVWRFATGIGTWGDEPYAVATSVRYALGDRPLVDSWDTNFSSAIVTLPFVRAWLAAIGSADGIMLGYRLLQLAITSMAAAIAYRALRAARVEPTAAGIVAAIILTYMPFFGPIVGYGMDCHWHMIAGFLALLQYHRTPAHAWPFVLPGIASMLGAIGNPPTVVVVPVFLAALMFAYRNRDTGRWRPAALYLAGATVTGIAFLIALRLLAGPDMLSMLAYVTRPDDHDFSIAAHVARLTSSMSVLVLPLVLGAILGGMMRLRHTRDARTTVAIAVGLAVPSTYALLGTGRLILPTLPQSLAYASAVTALVAILISGARLDRSAALLVLPAAGAGLGWFLGSNAGVHTAMLATPMAFAATLCVTSDIRGTRPTRLLTLALAALALAIAAPGMLYTPEGITPAMTAIVRHGPYAGMFGTPAEAADQERMTRTLRSLPDIDGRALFLERFPLGYLITLDRPGTYSTWATSAGNERLQEYVDHTSNAPERIVLTRYAFDIQDGEFPADVNLDGFDSAFVRVHADDDFIVYDLITAE